MERPEILTIFLTCFRSLKSPHFPARTILQNNTWYYSGFVVWKSWGVLRWWTSTFGGTCWIVVAQIPLKYKMLMDRHLSTSVIMSCEGEGTKAQMLKNSFTVTAPSCQWKAADVKLSPNNIWKPWPQPQLLRELWLRSWFFSSWHNKLSFTHAATWVHHGLQKPFKSRENIWMVMPATCSALLQLHWYHLLW